MLFADERLSPHSDDSIDVDIILFKLNPCCNDPNFDGFAFFVICGVDSDDVLLTREDAMSHFLNGQCASRSQMF